MSAHLHPVPRHATPPLAPQPNSTSMPPIPGVPLHGPGDLVPPPMDDEPAVEDPPSPDAPGRPVKDPPVHPVEDQVPLPPSTWRMRSAGIVVANRSSRSRRYGVGFRFIHLAH